MTDLTVPAGLDGMRIDRAVATLTGHSRGDVARMIADCDISIDGLPVGSASRTVAVGNVLTVSEPRSVCARAPEPDPALDICVVYEDDDLVVVEKPKGQVVHPGAGVVRGTLVNGLLARYPRLAELARPGMCDPSRPGIVHRLDRGTSGLMLVALSETAFRALSADIAARRIRRVYRALLWGRLSDRSGTVDAPIGRSLHDRTLMAVSRAGKPAVTRYEVDECFEPAALAEPASLVTCELESGRTHQIRVHLSAMGHPVVGDTRYGGAVTRSRDPSRALSLDRPFLHAARLELSHPTRGIRLAFESSLPPDLQQVLAVVQRPA